MIGDPPNIMIGSAVKELTFMAFIQNLMPMALIIMLVLIPIFILLFRKQIQTTPELMQSIMDLDEKELLTDKKLLVKCVTVLGLTIVGFFIHQLVHIESATVALARRFPAFAVDGGTYA